MLSPSPPTGAVVLAAALTGLLSAGLVLVPVTTAQTCPPGASKIGEERIGDTLRIYCECQPGFELAGDACVETAETLDRQIEERLRARRRDIAYHQRMVGVWQNALRRLQQGVNPQETLGDWVKESEDAQKEALFAAVEFLLGPLADVVKEAHREGPRAWAEYQRVRPALRRARESLAKYRRVWSKYQRLRLEVERLDQELEGAEAALRHAVNVEEAAAPVHRFGERSLAILAVLNVVRTPLERQELLAAMADLQHASWELLKSAGARRLIEEASARGMRAVERGATIAKFAAEYGVAMTRFGIAWAQVNHTLEAIDDRERLAFQLARRIHENEDRRQALVTEAQRLEAARQGARAVKEESLRVIRAQEAHASYIAGDWFSATTGIRAPGTPLSR